MCAPTKLMPLILAFEPQSQVGQSEKLSKTPQLQLHLWATPLEGFAFARTIAAGDTRASAVSGFTLLSERLQKRLSDLSARRSHPLIYALVRGGADAGSGPAHEAQHVLGVRGNSEP